MKSVFRDRSDKQLTKEVSRQLLAITHLIHCWQRLNSVLIDKLSVKVS